MKRITSTLLALVALSSLGACAPIVERYAPTSEENETRVDVSCPEEDSCSLDYRAGSWYIDETRVDVSCPEEDSCSIDYRAGSWYVAPIVP